MEKDWSELLLRMHCFTITIACPGQFIQKSTVASFLWKSSTRYLVPRLSKILVYSSKIEYTNSKLNNCIYGCNCKNRKSWH